MRWFTRWIPALGILLAAAGTASTADDARVKEAMNRGLGYLRAQQKGDGSWAHGHADGATALAGLALLECGAPPEDPVVLKAANFVREAAVTTTYTYSIATIILFLDRLHDAQDDILIQSLAVRLLRGQQADACWGYQCLEPSAEEMRRMRVNLRARAGKVSGDRGKDESVSDGLPRDIEDEIGRIRRRRAGQEPITSDNRPDHSNAQFAVLALWVARRRGVPVDHFLQRVDSHFRHCQGADGGWGYISPRERGQPEPSTLGATCAGLLGLTLGHASNRATLRTRPLGAEGGRGARSLSHDPSVRTALQYLGSLIGPPAARKIAGPPTNPLHFYAMLWSLERVGVVYGLSTIGDRDWYSWGAEMILASQEQDGSWRSQDLDQLPDTCFALLFLRRSNLVQDLTDVIGGNVEDPGMAKLRAEQSGRRAAGPDRPINARSSRTSPLPDLAPESPGRSDPSLKPAPRDDSGVADPARLAEHLAGASPTRQMELIEAYKESKGAQYTEALGQVIQRLEGDPRERARDALANRLTRMSAETLRDKMLDPNPEIRAAACLAAGMREDPKQAPDLIRMLADPTPRVAQAAHVALKELSGSDFGPKPGAGRAERIKAIQSWEAWWTTRPK